MSQRGSQEVSDGDGRERCLLPEWCLRAAGFKPHEIRLVDDDLRGLLNQDDSVLRRDRCRERVEERRLARPRASRDKNVLAPTDGLREACRKRRCEGSALDQFLKAVAVRELRNGERRTIHRAWREHRGHARAVLEPGVERGLRLGDLVAAGTGDILDGDGQIPHLERTFGHQLHGSLPLHEHLAPAAVDHDLCHRRVLQEILDGPQERQDAVEAAHKAPAATWSK